MFIISFLFLIATSIEILIISLIVPITSNYLDVQSGSTFNIANYFPNFYLNLPKESKLSYLLIAFLSLFIIKNLFSLFVVFMKNTFVFDIGRTTSNFLYFSYLKKPYEYFLNINTSIILRNIQSEVPMYARLIFAIINIVQDFIFVCLLLFFLLFVNFYSTFFIAIALTSIGLIYFFIVRKYIKRWSELRLMYDEKKIKNIQQSFLGIRDLKLYNVEEMYFDEFIKTNASSIKYIKYERTLAEVPRVMFEIFLIISFFFIFQYLYSQNYLKSEVVSILGVYFFSAMIYIISYRFRYILSFSIFKNCINL